MMIRTNIFPFVILSCLAMSLSAQNTSIVIPPNESYNFDFLDLDADFLEPKQYAIRLKVKSQIPVQVQLTNKKSEKVVGGFGLAAKAKTALSLSNELGFKVNNPNAEIAEIKLIYLGSKQEKPTTETDLQIQFILSNTSDKAIPLLIPGVMNPNLSPNSKSNVRLPIGQEIFYRNGIKKYLVLVVDEKILEGTVIDIAAIIHKLNDKLQ